MTSKTPTAERARPEHVEARLSPPPVLLTERLTLRPMRLADAPALQRLFNDWEVVKHLNDRVPWPYPDDGAEAHIRACLKKRDRYYWTITFTGADEEALGLISIQPDRGNAEQRGFWLGRPYWGRGLMTEAAERVTEHAFCDLGWPHLWLGNAEPNTASHRVKEKQGAIIIARRPIRTVSGEANKVVWLLPREAWLERHGLDPEGAPSAKRPEGAPFPDRLRMPPTPVLESERLVLRPIREDDIAAMRRGFDDWEVVKHLSASVPWPLPPNNFELAMADTLAKMASGERCSWALTLKDADQLIGRIDLWADDGLTRDQRGFWLARAWWNQGLMTEAAERVTEYVFRELCWPHLWLCNSADNLASHRIKEKQGALEIARVPASYVSGPGVRVVWLLARETWLARSERN